MLIPLTEATLDRLLPRIATGTQYRYYWGRVPEFLRRALISVLGMVGFWLVSLGVSDDLDSVLFVAGFIMGLYWLWSPVYWASRRNTRYRKFPYGGFWQGRILDLFVTEELIRQEETVNDRGELVVIENRERRINLEVGDNSGFSAILQAKLEREHKGLARGQVAQGLVLSDRPDLARIQELTDIFVPSRRIWVSDYPVVQREVFEEVAQELQGDLPTPGLRQRPPRRDRRPAPPPDDRPGRLARREPDDLPPQRRSLSRRPSNDRYY